MSGGFGSGRAQQAQGPANLWSGYSQTQYQQPRGQIPFQAPPNMLAGPSYGGGIAGGLPPHLQGGGFYHQGGGFGGGRPSWPGFGYGGMPGRYGQFGTPGIGMSAWGNPYSGFSGGYAPFGPGSYSSPGAMPYGGGSGMYGGGTYNYNLGAQRMAAIPYQQMARSRFSMPYRPVEPPQQGQPQFGGMVGRTVNQAMNNPMNPASGCYYDSSQDEYICPGR